MSDKRPPSAGTPLIAAATALLAVPIVLGAVVASRGEFRYAPGAAVGAVAVLFVPAAAVTAAVGTVASARALRAAPALRTPGRVAVAAWGAVLAFALTVVAAYVVLSLPKPHGRTESMAPAPPNEALQLSGMHGHSAAALGSISPRLDRAPKARS